MINYQDDIQIFCITSTYNFSPPRKIKSSKEITTQAGKYEADSKGNENVRCVAIAHFLDKTNALIKYNADELDL